MSEINAKDVMKLRNKTGLSMMQCKKALIATGGDHEAAEEHLRKELKGKMEKRTDRAAGEGRIVVAAEGGSAAIVEMRAETDFTAKTDNFADTGKAVATEALKAGAGDVGASDAMLNAIEELKISTGENCSYARGYKLEGGTFGSYIHHDGKTGALVQAEGSIDEETLRQICMHVVAAVPRPVGVTSDDIPESVVEKERKFRTEQAIESGKPPEIAEKMVEGGMRKFFSEIALLEQDFVMDPSKKIKDVVGSDASIKAFLRWQVGGEND